MWQNTRVLTGIQPSPFADSHIRLLWVTDSHLQNMGDSRMVNLQKAIDNCNAWRPTAFVITGDIGDDALIRVQAAFYVLQTVQRPLITVIGNHDEWGVTATTLPTADLKKENVFNRDPFNYTTLLSSGDGTLTARCIIMDGNHYDDDPDAPPPGNSPYHQPGDRYGSFTQDVSGGYWRRYGAEQRAWVASVLAQDATSPIILLMTHYPIATDDALLMDIFQADGRPMICLCGHQHPDGFVFSKATSDGLGHYNWYKTPAMLESGCWCRMELHEAAGAIVVDSLALQNYTDPGGWTINAPFSV